MAKNANVFDGCEHLLENTSQQKTIPSKLNKTITCLLSSALMLMVSLPVFAEQEKLKDSYGPIKAGETLWDIAKATRVNKDISVEQQIFALYKANPEAFKTGNMNVLPQGKVLKIPDEEFVTNTNKVAAKAQLNKHARALDVLRVDARQLKAAKIKTINYKKSVNLLQRQLGKYHHKSRSWNKAYTKLVAAKRKYASSKRNVAKLNSLLLEKATLKYTKPTKKEVESQALVAVKDLESKTLDAVKDVESKTLVSVKEVESNALVAVKAVESKTLGAVKEVESTTLKAVTELGEKTLKAVKEVESKSLVAVNETNERLSQIQSSLSSITESSSSLTEKVNALATLNERVVVLEEELGKNDDILIQLKSSVEKLEVAIEKTTTQLKLQSEKHQQQIKELSALKKAKSQQVASIQNLAESQVEVAENPDQGDKEIALIEASKVAEPETVLESQAQVEVSLSANDVIETAESNQENVEVQEVAAKEKAIDNLSTESTAQETTTPDESEKVIVDTPENNTEIPELALAENSNVQAMKVSFSPEINDSIAANTGEESLDVANTNQLTDSITKPKKTRNQLSEFQTDDVNAIAAQKGSGSWTDILVDNWIFLVTIINGLILMFVFYWTIKNNSYPEDD